MPRVTQTQIRQVIAVLRKRTGLPLVVEWAYGRPRVYLEVHGGVRELSPRLSTGEMMLWLQGFEEGLDKAPRYKSDPMRGKYGPEGVGR